MFHSLSFGCHLQSIVGGVRGGRRPVTDTAHDLFENEETPSGTTEEHDEANPKLRSQDPLSKWRERSIHIASAGGLT